MQPTAAPLTLSNLTKSYGYGQAKVKVLHEANLELKAGECVGLVAPSGSGKSTLLHLAGLLDRPDDGEIRIAGKPMAHASDRRKTRTRREHIGFVYQFHHLLPEFTALENVMMPQLLAGTNRKEALENATLLLERVGLAHRMTHRPGELSGGEQQRTAIARALANHPSLLLADEPTGNLDPHTAEGVFSLLMEEIRARGTAALVVTHNPDIAAIMDRVVTLRDGQIEERS